MTNSFLPHDYDGPPTSSRYFKPQIGRARIRIISNAITGSLFWHTTQDGRRPVRRRMNEQVLPSELEHDPRTGKPEKIKHFWACTIWNVDAGAVQLWEITQATVMDAILALINTPEWADVTQYDLVITRIGEGLETKYGIAPTPMAPLSDAAQAEITATQIDLDALFRGEDPFDASPAPQTPQADPAAGGPQAGTLETVIASIDAWLHGDGHAAVNVWACNTGKGRFGTTDAGVGESLAALEGKRVRIEWTQTGSGFRIDSISEITSSSPAPLGQGDVLDGPATTDIDIPF